MKIVFCVSEAKSLATTKEKYAAAGEKWRKLTDDEKKEYHDKIGEFSKSKEITWPKIQKIMRQMHSEVKRSRTSYVYHNICFVRNAGRVAFQSRSGDSNIAFPQWGSFLWRQSKWITVS